MSSFIDHIEIKNFKSIRHLEMNGFKKINLFIGKPNVGKSNILEALSIFTIPLLVNYPSVKLNDLVRAESMLEIFHQGNFQDSCKVLVQDRDGYYRSTLGYINDSHGDKLEFTSCFSKREEDLGTVNNFYLNFDKNFERDSPMGGGKGSTVSHIRRYIFKKGVLPETKGASFLFPPLVLTFYMY
jgi:predicted ATPase